MKSIRGTIFTWYFTSVVCFILASVTFFFFASKIIIKEFAVADHARLNTFIAKNLQAHFDNKLLPIERLAQRCQAINCTQETAITMVKTFLELLPDYSSIHLYDSFGDLVFHTRQAETPKYIPKPNIKIEKLEILKGFSKVLHSKGSHIIRPQKNRKGFLFQINMVPILKNGEVVYVVAAGVAPNVVDLSYLIDGLELSKNNFSFLANSDGKPIVQGNTKDKNIDWIGIQKWLSKSSVGTSTTSTRLNKDGSEFILFASLIPNAGIWFVSGINRQLLMGKEKIVLKYLALILVFGFTLSFVFSNFLGRFFSKPFDQITYALKQLQLGNLSYRIPYNKNNEFGYLCHLINVLAEKILKDRIIGNFWSNKEELKKIKRGDKL